MAGLHIRQRLIGDLSKCAKKKEMKDMIETFRENVSCNTLTEDECEHLEHLGCHKAETIVLLGTPVSHNERPDIGVNFWISLVSLWHHFDIRPVSECSHFWPFWWDCPPCRHFWPKLFLAFFNRVSFSGKEIFFRFSFLSSLFDAFQSNVWFFNLHDAIIQFFHVDVKNWCA